MVASVLGIFAPLASVEIDLKKKKKPKRREIEMAAKYIPVCTEACSAHLVLVYLTGECARCPCWHYLQTQDSC